MKNILRIQYADFKKEMDQIFKGNEYISTKNLLDTYLKVLGNKTNVLKSPDLKKLLFKQCKHNCALKN